MIYFYQFFKIKKASGDLRLAFVSDVALAQDRPNASATLRRPSSLHGHRPASFCKVYFLA
jgi:hypothetical protein